MSNMASNSTESSGGISMEGLNVEIDKAEIETLKLRLEKIEGRPEAPANPVPPSLV
jgi:hypothetical protein